ncbi:hypothetical protein Tco_0758670 [Tanacetum coccineum]
MSSPKFAETHNVVAFLENPVESDGFAEIIDYLKASSVHYALTVNPIIYTSCIEQFWATAKVQTVNGVHQLQALVNKKRVIVTESSIRRDLHLDDAEASEEMGEDSDHPTDSTQIPIIYQPSSSSQPKKKQPSRKGLRDRRQSFLKMNRGMRKFVLDLEKAKDAQAKGNFCCLRRDPELERKKMSRPTDQESLGAPEDASKQGRSIADLDKDDDVTLVD